jgi:hypothetical protein
MQSFTRKSVLNFIWAIGNKTWIGLLALIPYVNIVVIIILGIKGRQWAWQKKRWDSVKHFQEVQKKWSFWGFIITGGFLLIGGLILIISVIGLGDSPEVEMVKGGTLQFCPNTTVNQMVNSFIASPSWESDITQNNQKFVNITGNITLQGKPVEALVQFFVDDKNETFVFNAFEINNIPQNNIMTTALLTKMCASANK